MPDLKSEWAVTTDAVTKRVGGTTLVEELTLQVPRRGVYGFLGPNGAGKTTTIRLLLGLLRPTQGRIVVLGDDMATRRAAILRATGALVEGPSLYPHLTGEENLRIAASVRGVSRARVGEVLDVVGLRADGARTVRQYSLGMRQRLGLAQALLARPALLILDEPTNGLDPQGIRDMRRLVVALAEQHDMAVFLASHLLAEVELVATSVGVIRDGRLLFQGPLAELHARTGTSASLRVDDSAAVADLLRRHGVRATAAAGEVCLPDATAPMLATVNALVVGAGHRLFQSHLVAPSLEDIFLAMTTAGR